MAVLSAKDIFTYALQAGFTPDEAVTMTAIALAESGGNTGAHNPKGEDSLGPVADQPRRPPEHGRGRRAST